MDKMKTSRIEFSPTVDISLLRKAGVDLSSQYTIIPGFCDVHVHFREPGFSYKETIKTGAEAAAHGGYTAVCTMPNLNPVADTEEHLDEQLAIIENDACIHVYPYAAITIGQKGEELADLESMADKCIAFSDDGHGVQSDDMMREAMLKAKSLGKMIVAHCEVNDLLKGGYIHDGKYAAEHGHRGICAESCISESSTTTAGCCSALLSTGSFSSGRSSAPDTGWFSGSSRVLSEESAIINSSRGESS